MKTLMTFVLVVVACTAAVNLAIGSDDASGDAFAWRWYELDDQGKLQLNLYVFWRSTCPHCPAALNYTRQLQDRYDWLQVRTYEISRHAGNLELYRRMANSLNRPAGSVPAFVFCNQLVMSYHSPEDGLRRIETPLVRCYQYLRDQLRRSPANDQPDSEKPAARVVGGDGGLLSVQEQPTEWHRGWILAQVVQVPAGDDLPLEASPSEDAMADLRPSDDGLLAGQELDLELPPAPTDQESIVELPFVGATDAREMSLPVLTVVLAACDAFNPCAFFVLLSLLSLLIHARNRWRILIIGGIFVFFSGLFYFLFMAAWLNVFFLAGNLRWITVLAGVLAIVIASINIKDYFFFRRGISLSIPDEAKPGLFERMRRLVDSVGIIPMLIGTLALAVAANSYELLCTAGFPMVFTRVLTLNELPTAGYYGYLALYNLVYVIPLAAIVVLFTITLGRRKLSENEGRILKLLSGIMMLLLGLLIIISPEALQRVATALGILLGAVGLTGLIVFGERWFHIRKADGGDGGLLERRGWKTRAGKP